MSDGAKVDPLRAEIERALSEEMERARAEGHGHTAQALDRLRAALAAHPEAPPSPPAETAPAKHRSCNRHDDCDAADAKAKARFEEDRKKPYREQNPNLWPYTEHCHDECCEDCFGS